MSVLDQISPDDAIIVLTGAGISQESGLETVSGKGVVWENYRLNEIAKPEMFVANPRVVLEFYNARRLQLRDASVRPNAAHKAIASLENFWPGDVLVVTQNVDNLHERAGTRNLIHMHGELAETCCNECDNVFEDLGDLRADMACGSCGGVGTLRPHVVWFGENPMKMDEICVAIAACSLFISIGTSGGVAPAAEFVQEARRHGAKTIELNMEKSLQAELFDEARYGRATKVVTKFVDELKAYATT